MKRNILQFIVFVVSLLSLCGCAQTYNNVLKCTDNEYKYEFAKEMYARGKYNQAITVLQDIVTIYKGTGNGEECLYLMAMAQFHNKDYETAAEYFKKYHKTYSKGIYAEQANFYIGESLFMGTPEPRLDQTQTIGAIAAFQDFLDIYPESKMKDLAQDRLIQLQDKLVRKELLSAQLYYNLGSYFGNCLSGGSNYEACIVTSQNALKDYPYSNSREDFNLLIMKSKYYLAKHSVEERQAERYRDAEDECYGFINEYPDSKSITLAKEYIRHCKKHLGEKMDVADMDETNTPAP
ncbi:MAG: outer membrane protein assembly factor BamD [Bacteroidaceae bacterium]|nr:outer membrane protein assembly factor BamD [Bacteroidaceae bacterium]